eukprot:1751336-Amphidinium_carterae.1
MLRSQVEQGHEVRAGMRGTNEFLRMCTKNAWALDELEWHDDKVSPIVKQVLAPTTQPHRGLCALG